MTQSLKKTCKLSYPESAKSLHRKVLNCELRKAAFIATSLVRFFLCSCLRVSLMFFFIIINLFHLECLALDFFWRHIFSHIPIFFLSIQFHTCDKDSHRGWVLLKVPLQKSSPILGTWPSILTQRQFSWRAPLSWSSGYGKIGSGRTSRPSHSRWENNNYRYPTELTWMMRLKGWPQISCSVWKFGKIILSNFCHIWK